MSAKSLFHHPFYFGKGMHTQNHPNRIRRFHGTDCWLLEFNVQGAAVIDSPSGDKIIMGKHSLFCYRPEICQVYEIAPGTRMWEHYWICFTPSERLLQWLDWREKFKGFSSLSISSPTLIYKLKRIFSEGINLSASHYPNRYAQMENLVERILLLLDMENPRKSYQRIDERIRKCLTHIDKNLANPIGKCDLARVSGLSPSRFAHLFRSTMGLSPLRYLEVRRMDWAADLLQTTVDPISAIANRVGYDDPLYFSRVFRKVKRISPRYYRKRGK